MAAQMNTMMETMATRKLPRYASRLPTNGALVVLPVDIRAEFESFDGAAQLHDMKHLPVVAVTTYPAA